MNPITYRPEGPSKHRWSDYDPTKDPAIIQDTLRSRPKYFDGQFLTAADLNREQNYLLARQSDFASALGFGVIEGLQVTTADRVHEVKVSAGVGITPAGDVVQLPEMRTVDLAAIELMREVNARFGVSQVAQAPFDSLEGLFVFGLRQVEFTANPVPMFPASLNGNQPLTDGDIVEATAFTLVPYELGANDTNDVSRVARQIFLEGRPAATREGVLPLAMLRLRHGQVLWIDQYLVRREVGDDDRFGFGFAPRALAEAHFHHFRARIAKMPDGPIAARDVFQILPPGGPLPKGTVDLGALTHTFFPSEARVEIALVPEDELELIMRESLQLPPLDLSLKPEDNDELAILVLALMPRANFDDNLTLIRPRNLTATATPGRRTRLSKAFAKLQELGTTPVEQTAEADALAKQLDEDWRKALAKAQPELWYVRRRNFTLPGDLAALPQATLALRQNKTEEEIERLTSEVDRLRKALEIAQARANTTIPLGEREEGDQRKELQGGNVGTPMLILRAAASLKAFIAIGQVVARMSREGQNDSIEKFTLKLLEKLQLPRALDRGVIEKVRTVVLEEQQVFAMASAVGFEMAVPAIPEVPGTEAGLRKAINKLEGLPIYLALRAAATSIARGTLMQIEQQLSNASQGEKDKFPAFVKALRTAAGVRADTGDDMIVELNKGGNVIPDEAVRKAATEATIIIKSEGGNPR